MTNDSDLIKSCSLCGKNQDEVSKIFVRPGVSDMAICSNCVTTCYNALSVSDGDVNIAEFEYSECTPSTLYNHLSEYVVGQEDAKKVLSVAAYNHYKRIKCSLDSKDDVEIYKSNVMLIGPSGCGKTLLASALAKKLDVPFAISDSTTLTEAGYVGDDVENILTRLLQAAGNDVEKAQRGIIYLDEIDKLARKSSGASSVKDVSGEGVQQALLKLVEGTVVSVPVQGSRRGAMQQDYVQIDTTNILFICGGAFEDLDKVILSRQSGTSIGFGANLKGKSKDNKVDISLVTSADLIKYGIIPEFTGRFPVIVTLKELTEKQLVDILVIPKNALMRQYEKLFEMDNVALSFSQDALKYVACEAMEKKTGARGLRAIMEDILLNLMFDIPESDISSIHVTKSLAKKGRLLLKDLKKGVAND